MARSTRAEVGLAVLLCLVGAFVVLVSAGRPWAQVAVEGGSLLPDRTVDVAGRDLVAGLQALGTVGLAGAVAIAATRRWGRVAVGAVLLGLGAGVVALVAGALSGLDAEALAAPVVREAGRGGAVSVTPWPYAGLLGGLLLGAAGLLVAVRGRRWAALSERYEVPVPGAQDQAPREPAEQAQQGGARAERELWEALDRGEDPTAR